MEGADVVVILRRWMAASTLDSLLTLFTGNFLGNVSAKNNKNGDNFSYAPQTYVRVATKKGSAVIVRRNSRQVHPVQNINFLLTHYCPDGSCN